MAVSLLLVTSGVALAAAPEEPDTGIASAITNTSANLQGTVNPHAIGIVSWHFNYAQGGSCEGGKATPVQGPAEVEALAAEALVTKLQPGTEYTFCLVVSNEAEETTIGKPSSFVTSAAAPSLVGESVATVNATEASVSAEISPGGEPTSYHVEYGATEPFIVTSNISVPSAEGGVRVLVRLTGLEPSTQYRFRFVANSTLGQTVGGLTSFTTNAPSSSGSAGVLPDGRAYELVAPAEGNQEVYVPLSILENELGNKSDVFTERPFRAAADGTGIAFVDEPSPSGEGTGNQGQGAGDEWLSHRTSSGWAARDIQPPLTNGVTEFQAFSSDLGLGYINTFRTDRLSAEGPANCQGLYSRNNLGVFRSLFSSTESPGFCGNEHEPIFAGESENGSQAFFETPAALTEGSIEAAGGPSENLYESAGGLVRLVNVLPTGGPDPNATFGGPPNVAQERVANFGNAVSQDGSRVIWTDVNTGVLYLREGATRTIQLSAGNSHAQYWTATSDDAHVLYTEEGQLVSFNVDKFRESHAGESEALAAAREVLVNSSSGVNGVLGASDDGAYIYFVAAGVLAANETADGEKATMQTCREAPFPTDSSHQEENVGNLEGGGCNLYVLHIGEAPRFIATLAPKDNNLPVGGNTQRAIGDWRPDLGSRAAEVSRDGQHLVFESRQRLTGYDNGGVSDPEIPTNGREREVEIFVYDDSSGGQLACASCNPSGARPVVFTEHHGGGTSLPPSIANTFLRRWMNESGTRVVFNTSQALVPEDTNGVQDVYEWERDGSGSCRQSSNCIYLLSGGNSSDNSFLIDASSSGGDIFFATRAELVRGVGNQKMELYDAHECTSSAPCSQSVSLACTGTGCQGVPPGPPSFATPASVTSSGSGNLLTPAHPSPPRSSPKTPKEIRAEKLARALKKCRAKKNQRARKVCEAKAKRRYGAKKNAGKSQRVKETTRRERARG